ncbi:unnamed protein product [Penicillium pancosmium]
MASILQSAIRRSARTISSKTIKPSTRQFLPSTSALPHSATTRGLTSLSRRSALTAQNKQYQIQTQQTRAQIRWSSNQSKPEADPEQINFRQWGFEEITATLPSTTPSSSPTHTPILIDVREPAELAQGIIPHALSIPLASQPDAMYLTPDEFETRFGFPKPSADGETELVFYCKAGVRADAAARLAVQAGYDAEKIGVYYGSWLDWVKNGGKVEVWDGDE